MTILIGAGVSAGSAQMAGLIGAQILPPADLALPFSLLMPTPDGAGQAGSGTLAALSALSALAMFAAAGAGEADGVSAHSGVAMAAMAAAGTAAGQSAFASDALRGVFGAGTEAGRSTLASGSLTPPLAVVLTVKDATSGGLTVADAS